MLLNFAKSQYHDLSKQIDKTDVSANIISFFSELKFLGVFLDDELVWSAHNQYLVYKLFHSTMELKFLSMFVDLDDKHNSDLHILNI